MALRGQRLTIALVVGLVTVLVLGGAAALAVSSHQNRAEGTPLARLASGRSTTPALTPAARTSASGSGSATAGTVESGSQGPSSGADSSSVPAGSGSKPVESSESSSAAPTQAGGTSADPTSAPAGPSNNLTVQMSPSSRAHPRSQDVQLLLQGYFDAINQHNYASWTQSVTTVLESHQNSAQWLQAYATTVDSSIWMEAMRDDPLEVRLHFTSQQDADLAPKDLPVPCIHWTITYQLAEENGRLVVGSTVPGSVTMTKCAG